MKEAMYYQIEREGAVRCSLCPHRCLIEPGGIGRCQVRQNIDGKLMSLNYGQISGIAFDPIEKKPLVAFEPRAYILSLGSYGCNFRCDFCQNWQLAQKTPKPQVASIEQLTTLMKTREDNIGMAYTYNEPTVFYEFMFDLAKAVHGQGYKNVMVTNGYINLEPLKALLPYIDAFNVDLKSFENEFYEKLCGGGLTPVMEAIKTIHGHAHLEITVLLIDGQNTSDHELEALFQWIAAIDNNIPVHLTRYFPANRMALAPTKLNTLLRAKEIGIRYLNYVYLGNI